MHPQFAEWYRPLLIQPDDKLLKSRWALVESTASSLTAPLALDLVRLSFGLPVQDDAAIATLKQQLKSEGLNYVRATANLELALIADFSLSQVLESKTHKLSSMHQLLASVLTCQQNIRFTIGRIFQKEIFALARTVIDQASVTQRRPIPEVGKDNEGDDLPVYREPSLVTEKTQSIHIGDRNGYINQNIQIQAPDLNSINETIKYVYLTQKATIADINKDRKSWNDKLSSTLSMISKFAGVPQEEILFNGIYLAKQAVTSNVRLHPFNSLS